MIAEEEALNRPLTCKFCLNVEEDWPMKPRFDTTNPFAVSTVNTDELAAFNILNALAVFTQVWMVVEP